MLTIRNRNGRYSAQFRIKKAGAIVYQESSTFDTETQARAWGAALTKKVERDGIDGHKSTSTSIAAIVNMHQATMQSSGSDVRGSINSLNALRNAPFASKPIGVVKSGDIARWVKTDYATTRAPGTVLHALMTLRAAYRNARVMEDIPADISVVADATAYLIKIGLAGKSTERDRRVTDAEVDAICTFHEKKNDIEIPLRTIVTLAIALPRRVSELTSMRWEDYNGAQVKLWSTKDPTTVRNEVIPIPPGAKTILDTLVQKPKGIMLPYNPRSVSSAFHRAAAMLQIDDLHFHDLRHEGVSRLFQAGLNIPEVALISGHKSWATLRRYTHLTPHDVLEKLNAGRKRQKETATKPE